MKIAKKKKSALEFFKVGNGIYRRKRKKKVCAITLNKTLFSFI